MAYNFGQQQNFYGGAQGIMGNESVVDKVPAEMLFLVDAYWFQFKPINPLWHSLLGFALTIFCLIAFLGNLCVIYIFTKTRSLRSPSNLLVVNLAVSDFAIMASMGPPMIVNCFYENWVFGPLMCQIYGMCGSLFGCVSIWTMTMIAFDRYNVIVKGITGKPLTHSGAVVRILFVWAASLVWTILPLFGWNRYVPEGNMTACGTDYLTKGWYSRSYVLIYGIWVYFVPLFLIIYSYYFIMKAVSAHEKNMREQAKKMNVASLRSSENSNTSTECKLAKVALMTISLWFLAWTPYLIINFACIFELAKITPLGSIWGSVFAKANSIYNPIVYGISHPKYRAALIKTFPSLACGESNVDSDSKSQVTEMSAAPCQDEKLPA